MPRAQKGQTKCGDVSIPSVYTAYDERIQLQKVPHSQTIHLVYLSRGGAPLAAQSVAHYIYQDLNKMLISLMVLAATLPCLVGAASLVPNGGRTKRVHRIYDRNILHKKRHGIFTIIHFF